jgi:hypothetical protein
MKMVRIALPALVVGTVAIVEGCLFALHALGYGPK